MNSSMIVSNIDSTPRKMFVNDETDVKMMYLLRILPQSMDDGDDNDNGRSSSMQQQLPQVQCFTKDERRMLAVSTFYDTTNDIPNIISIRSSKTTTHSKALLQKRINDINIVHMQQIKDVKKGEEDVKAIGKTNEMKKTKKKDSRSGSREWFSRFVTNLRFAQTVHVV